jgi:hypothetical protein
MNDVHRIEIIPRPHWRRFLRRDHVGRIANDHYQAREANARHAIRHDRQLMHLVALGDVEACRRRLCFLGIEAHAALISAIIEGRL